MSFVCNIRGISVSFPFEPYELQKEYMDKVIQCLQNNQNGVLESPTGTGKTLSLLCSSLAWLAVKKAQVQEQLKHACYPNYEDESFFDSDGAFPDKKGTVKSPNTTAKASMKNDDGFEPSYMVPKIIYSSRTHTQLSQAMKELKRTAYSHVKSTVLGGRDQLCIHPEVMQERNNAIKGNLCGLKVKTKSCQFYNRGDKKLSATKNIMDIEDLVVTGKKERFCPYYAARDLHKNADIIFMPYNYLLDGKVRKSFGISLTNCIVIFDEAHNIERISEDSASTQLKKSDIVLGIEEVNSVTALFTGEKNTAFLNEEQLYKLNNMNLTSLANLKQALEKLANILDGIDVKDCEQGTAFPGDHIYKIMKEAGISNESKDSIKGITDEIIMFLSTLSSGPISHRGNGLARLLDLLNLVFADSGSRFTPITPEQQQKFIEKVRKCYKVHVSQTNKNGNPFKKNSWLSNVRNDDNNSDIVLSFWCFSPGFGMNMLMEQKPKCLILTSGTLAPLKPLISELELKIDVRLENPHIVNSDQVCVKVIKNGPDSYELNSTFNKRNNPAYIESLGKTIKNICRVLPGGLLIFFPSYIVMNACQNNWKIRKANQAKSLWNSISEIKAMFVEPRDKDEFRQSMKDYYESVNDSKYAGAIFMGVCRGKVSEGLDFANANGRGVIITGLPYAPYMDSRIALKREYLNDCKKTDKEFLSGAEWYQMEATRAVNQAIGRVIRHRHDYGIILLADSRFADPNIMVNMSKWLRNRIQVVPHFGNLIATTKQFFREAESKYPVKMVEEASKEAALFWRIKKTESSEEVDGNVSIQIIPEEAPISETAVKEVTKPTLFSRKIQVDSSEEDDANGSSSSVEFIAELPEQVQILKRRKITSEPDVADKISPNSEAGSKDFILMLE